jgi:hypothetical protein
MPLRIELRARSGEIMGVTGEAYDEVDAMLPELEEGEFPLLSGVDRYGNTVFNGKQMARIAYEIKRLIPDAPPRRAKMLRELLMLCMEGAKVPDAQLWFLGD